MCTNESWILVSKASRDNLPTSSLGFNPGCLRLYSIVVFGSGSLVVCLCFDPLFIVWSQFSSIFIYFFVIWLWSKCMLLVSYIFFLSKTFLTYINIMFLTLLTYLSCSILYLCLFCYKMGGKWLIDLDWFIVMKALFFHGLIHILDTCSLAGSHIDLDFSLLPYFDYLVIFFPTNCFTLGICVLV